MLEWIDSGVRTSGLLELRGLTSGMAVTAVSIWAYVHFDRYALSDFSGRHSKLFAVGSLNLIGSREKA